MNDITPYKCTLLSALHRETQRCFNGKQELAEFILDVLHSLPEEMKFQMQISRGDDGGQRETQLQSYQNGYEVDVLMQQLLLFEREEEMANYVQTEKLVAGDALTQLTQLSIALLKLGKQLLQDRKPLLPLKVKEQQYSREQLDRIQAECLNTLSRVREQRKRAENCCICLSTRSDHILLPCMHLVLCRGCAGQRLARCPMCSQPIREIREVYH